MNGARRYGPEKLKLTLFTIGKKYECDQYDQ